MRPRPATMLVAAIPANVLSLHVTPICRVLRRSQAALTSPLSSRAWSPVDNVSSSERDMMLRFGRMNPPWQWLMASAASVEVAGDGGLMETKLVKSGSVGEVEAGQEPAKKRNLSTLKATSDNKVKKEKKPQSISERRKIKISLDDVMAADQGLHAQEEEDEEEFEGWEFVEDGEETDDARDGDGSKDVPFWSGPEPAITEQGKLAGIAPEAVRIARKAVFSSQHDEDTDKVETDDEFQWYLLRCFATYELRCRDAVESFVHACGMGDQIDKIWVPTRQVPKQVGKSVKIKEEPIYPGYLYCHVKMTQQLRDMVNDMDKIVGFVGERRDGKKKPIPDRLGQADVEGAMASERELNQNITTKLLAPGDLVEIVEGPFKQRNGEVTKVRDGEYVVKVNAFGKNSDVKVAWEGVRKLSELEVETWFEETRRALDATYMERENRSRGGGRGGGRGQGRGRGRGRHSGDLDPSNRYSEDGRWTDTEGRERGRRSSAGVGLRGFSGVGLGGELIEEEEEAQAARRRFMERDLQAWEAETVGSGSSPPRKRRRRPSGDEVDAELPERAFESDKDANTFFDSLDDILGTPDDGSRSRRLPALPGARAQGPSVVERAHAAAERRSTQGGDQGDDSLAPRASAVAETGSTGNAGALEEGFSVVSRDSAIAGTNLDAEEEDQDDFFAALMQELREAPSSPPPLPPPSTPRGESKNAPARRYGDGYSSHPPQIPPLSSSSKVPALGGEGYGFEQVLAGLERGEALEVAAAAAATSDIDDGKKRKRKRKEAEGIDDIFAELGLDAEGSPRLSNPRPSLDSRPLPRDTRGSRVPGDERRGTIEKGPRNGPKNGPRNVQRNVPRDGPRNDDRINPRNGLRSGFGYHNIPGSSAGRDVSEDGLPLTDDAQEDASGIPASGFGGRLTSPSDLFSDLDLLLPPPEARLEREDERKDGFEFDFDNSRGGMRKDATPYMEDNQQVAGVPGGDGDGVGGGRARVSSRRRDVMGGGRGGGDGGDERVRAEERSLERSGKREGGGDVTVAAKAATMKGRLEDRFRGEERSLKGSRQRQRSGERRGERAGLNPSQHSLGASIGRVAGDDPLDAIVGAFLGEDEAKGGEMSNADPVVAETSEGSAGVSKIEGEDGDGSTVGGAPAEQEMAMAISDGPNEAKAVGKSSAEKEKDVDIGGMKVVELKEKCRSMGLPVSGRKAELQERILKALG